MENKSPYNTVLLKISGDFFKGEGKTLSFESVNSIITQIAEVNKMGVRMGVVVGGGNIMRGARESERLGIASDELDHLGMIATVINGGMLSSGLRSQGVKNTVISALPVQESVGIPYSRHRVLELLSDNEVLIFVGGTGNPYFTTDTASVLRGLQIDADILLKGTDVEGVYDKDPRGESSAKLYRNLTYSEAMEKELKIMDITAFSMASFYRLPILVFNAMVSGNIKSAVMGEKIGTVIRGG